MKFLVVLADDYNMNAILMYGSLLSLCTLLLLKMGTVLPQTEARAFNKLNEKRMLKAPRIDAHVLLFENVRLLLNCL